MSQKIPDAWDAEWTADVCYLMLEAGTGLTFNCR